MACPPCGVGSQLVEWRTGHADEQVPNIDNEPESPQTSDDCIEPDIR